MNISRYLADGTRHPEESLNKAQLFITTAGWKNEFPYDKLIQILVGSVVEPDKYFVMGGTWRVKNWCALKIV